jgi:hypothetical protein
LVAGHFERRGPIQVALLAGLSATDRVSRHSGFSDKLTLDGELITHSPYDRRFAAQWFALALGIDVAIAVTKHLSIVPRLRLYAYPLWVEAPSLFITRPGLAVRWQF